MSYGSKPPTPSEAHQNDLRVLYSQTKVPVAKMTRHIPQAPDRILDAPDIVNVISIKNQQFVERLFYQAQG